MSEAVAIVMARPEQLALLPEVERAADTVFETLRITDLPPPGSVADLLVARAVLVAGDPPVGFLRVEEVDGRAHIEQLSVHPAWARRGVGSRLLRAGLRWAAECDYRESSLITFGDVAWNAPFYERHGFRPMSQLTAGLITLREHEHRAGLDQLGTRVVLYRTVTGRV